MFTECAVFSSTAPICSATCMNRLLNTSSMHRVGAVADGLAPRDAARAREHQATIASHCRRASRARRPSSRSLPRSSAGPAMSRRREVRARVERRRPRHGRRTRCGASRRPRGDVSARGGVGGASCAVRAARELRRASSSTDSTASAWLARPHESRSAVACAARTRPQRVRGGARSPKQRAALASVPRSCTRDACARSRRRRAATLAPRARARLAPRARRTLPPTRQGARVERRLDAVLAQHAQRLRRPMPYADSTPASGWISTVPIAERSATWHACCPAAPPKQHSAKRATSWPRWTEICLIAFAIARRRSAGSRPRAARSELLARSRREPRAASAANAADALRRRAADPRPRRTRAGRSRGWMRPSSTFASVTVSGPPRAVAGGPGHARPRTAGRPAAGRSRTSAPSRRRRRPCGSAASARSRARLRSRPPRPLELAREQRDVGRRAAHVEADHLVEPAALRRAQHADRRRPQDPTAGCPCRGTRRASASPPWLCMNFSGTAVELRARPRADARNVAREHRREIGVDERRVAARDELQQRAHACDTETCVNPEPRASAAASSSCRG